MNRRERRASRSHTLRMLKGGRYGHGFATNPHGRLLESLVVWAQETSVKAGLDATATVAMLLRAAALIGAQKTPVTEDEFAEAARTIFRGEIEAAKSGPETG